MSALLIWDTPLVEHSGVLLRNLAHIGKEYIETFYFREDCRAYAALAAS